LSLCFGTLFLFPTVLAQPTPSIQPAQTNEHDPAAELASFTIAPGFEVKLFASEKNDVVKPIQMRFDPQGRIWVIGSTVYPQLEPGQVPNDKVLVLEDTDRDGVCDKTTVFADGLMIPTGIELGDGGVYLGHGTATSKPTSVASSCVASAPATIIRTSIHFFGVPAANFGSARVCTRTRTSKHPGASFA
jgi:glucose/arabinose dehydrogenase